jgi:hypothetical protein
MNPLIYVCKPSMICRSHFISCFRYGHRPLLIAVMRFNTSSITSQRRGRQIALLFSVRHHGVFVSYSILLEEGLYLQCGCKQWHCEQIPWNILSRNVRFCFILYQCDFPVTGGGIRDIMYRLQRRNCIVPRSTVILKWVAINQKANSRLGGKGGSSLTVHVLVIVFYVVIDIIFCTLRYTDDGAPLLKILMRTVELLKHQCLRTVTYEPLVMIS